MTYLYLLGRLLLGGYFILSGYKHFVNLNNLAGYAVSKKVPAAKFSVGLSGVLLLLGGLGILFNAYVIWTGWALVLFLVSVTFTMHNFWKETDPMRRLSEQINFQKNLALLGAVLIWLALVY